MSLRRSARTQPGRSQNYPEDLGHVESYATQANEVTMGMMGLGGFGNHYQQQQSPAMGYYNPGAGYPHSYGHQQHPGQFGHHSQHQSQVPGYQHHDASSMRILRTRNSGGTVTAPASSTTVSPSPHTTAAPTPVARGRRGGSSSTASTAVASSSSGSHHHKHGSASHSQRTEQIDVDNDEWGDEAEMSEGPFTSKSKAEHASASGIETKLSIDQMAQNCVFYLLLQQQKKVPVKKSDLIKHGMNSQYADFDKVMTKLEQHLNEIFGLNLVRLEKGKDNANIIVTNDKEKPTQASNNPNNDDENDDNDDNDRDEAAGPSTSKASKNNKDPKDTNDKRGRNTGKGRSTDSYIIYSKFPNSVSDSVVPRHLAMDAKRTILYLVLAAIYMTNRAIDEEAIWKIILEMQLDQWVCEKRSDLRKFLKSEFVSSGYLNMELENEPNHLGLDLTNVDGFETGEDKSAKFTWGPRAHIEYSKYAMLKFVTNRFPGHSITDFRVQYNMLSNEEKALAEKEARHGSAPSTSAAATNNDGGNKGDNGSAIQIRPKKSGNGETYVIDGENTETETEME